MQDLVKILCQVGQAASLSHCRLERRGDYFRRRGRPGKATVPVDAARHATLAETFASLAVAFDLGQLTPGCTALGLLQVGALIFILFMHIAIDMQLLCGVWILQAFAAVVFGLFWRWFRGQCGGDSGASGGPV